MLKPFKEGTMSDKINVNLTSEVNIIESKEKEKALKLLSQFDIEYCEDRNKVKHYPLDDYSETSKSEDLATRIERMSKVLWHTVAGYLDESIPLLPRVLDKGLIKPVAWDERPAKPKKIGKVLVCRPNRFSEVNVPVDVLQLYLYSCKLEDGTTELQGEVNFSIEIY
jgi:hypothetical protein